MEYGEMALGELRGHENYHGDMALAHRYKADSLFRDGNPEHASAHLDRAEQHEAEIGKINAAKWDLEHS